MTAHTPGPWLAEEGGFCFNVNAKNESVAFVPNGEDDASRANARLIAAAPELLHACQLALEVFDRTSVTDWEVLEKAIAKATGQ